MDLANCYDASACSRRILSSASTACLPTSIWLSSCYVQTLSCPPTLHRSSHNGASSKCLTQIAKCPRLGTHFGCRRPEHDSKSIACVT
eukprot:6102870-Amphidinium_carterae.1